MRNIPDVGIVRFDIQSDWVDSRTEIAARYAHKLDELWRWIFRLMIGEPLKPGLAVISCTKAEAIAKYDWKDGIDRILTTVANTRHSTQDKVLTYRSSTATFEEAKNSGEPGFWYYGLVQLYGVFYFRNGSDHCNDWIVLNFPMVRQMKDRIPWRIRWNSRDGRRNPFRFTHFRNFPPETIVACKIGQYGLFMNPMALDDMPPVYAV